MIGKINKALSTISRKNQLSPFFSIKIASQEPHLSFIFDHDKNRLSCPQSGHNPDNAFFKYVFMNSYQSFNNKKAPQYGAFLLNVMSLLSCSFNG